MDIDKNDLQILARRVPNILIECLKRYPKASFAWFSLFFSYIFFPTILWFLIYTIPFIVLITAISIKTFFSVHEARDANKDEKAKDVKSPRELQSEEDSSNENKKYNPKHARSVRRRRAKVTFEESKQDRNHEKESISSINATYHLIDKRELVEEIPKDIREVEVTPKVNDHVESSASDVSLDFRSRFNSLMRSQRFGSGVVDTEGIISENIEDEGDDSRGGERTSSQWTEDGQKNLADLGLSEIERTKRLENLIKKRRARKILSVHVRRAMGNLGNNDSASQMIYSIEIPKSTNISPRSDQFSPVPGSAPCILLPTRNPFDLPYEPHEEKPNLTGGSFGQEIFATNHKDMVFCRHESFTLGHNSSLYNNHGIKTEISERQEKTESPSGERDDENEIEHEQSQEVECDDKVENTDQNIQSQASEQGPDLNDVSHEDLQNEEKTKSVIVEDYNGRLSFSSSSEENEPISRLDKEKILKSLSTPPPISIQKGDGCISDSLYDYSSSETEMTKRSERFYYPHQAPRHTQSHSLASDMQVEVSEFGSPPQLSDMNISSPDEVRSLSDGKFEKEIPDSEDMWIALSKLSRVDENESRSRTISEAGKEDIIGVGFPRIKEYDIPAERVIAQDSSNPLPKFVGASEPYSDSIEHIIHEQPSTSYPNSSYDQLHNPDLHSSQAPSLPPSSSTKELDTNLSSSNLQLHNADNLINIPALGKEHEKSNSHESDEVIDCKRSTEKLRAEVEHPLEAKDETEKNVPVGTNVIHNEWTIENVDDESLFPDNTVKNKIHGEMQNSESGPTPHLQLDGEAQYFQEHTCSNSEKSNKSGSMLDIDDLLMNSSQQTGSQENLIIKKVGGGHLPDPGLAELEEYQRATTVNKPTGESSQLIFSTEVEKMSEEMSQQLEIQDNMSTEGNDILESTPDTEDEVSSIEIATHEPRQFVIHSSEVVSVPEIMTEQVPTALSTSSSPKSVLNPRFSRDQGYMDNLSDAIQIENQYSGAESSGSNSSSLPAQNEALSAEDLTTYQSQERSIERVQESSSSQLVSAEEATSTSGRLSSHDIDKNSTDHGQEERSGTSFSYTNTENQETNLDTISNNEEITGKINLTTSHSSELEKG